MPGTALTWDQTGDRYYHTGISKGVLFVQNDDGTYAEGVAWNGLTSVEEKPEGADAQDLWADNMKYASFRTAEEYKGTISAYQYPKEFEECDGSKEYAPGMVIGQQKRKPFAFCYRTEVGNDTAGESDDGYIIHIVYNATCNPTSRNHQTINDSPDAIEFSWDFDTVPIVSSLTGAKPLSTIDIYSKRATAAKLTALEATLYGSSAANSSLPTPDAIFDALKDT